MVTLLLEALQSLKEADDDSAAEPEVVSLSLHSERDKLLRLLDFKVRGQLRVSFVCKDLRLRAGMSAYK